MRRVFVVFVAFLVVGCLFQQSAAQSIAKKSESVAVVSAINSNWARSRLSETTISTIAEAFYTAAAQHGLALELLLAIAVNESDFNPTAIRTYAIRTDGTAAADVGLMGIRCRVRGAVRPWKSCLNVQGETVRSLQDPVRSINVGAQMIARLRTTCTHTGHPWYAHYNWGTRVFKTGMPAGYPRRVAHLATSIAMFLGRPQDPQLIGVSTHVRYNLERYQTFRSRMLRAVRL